MVGNIIHAGEADMGNPLGKSSIFKSIMAGGWDSILNGVIKSCKQNKIMGVHFPGNPGNQANFENKENWSWTNLFKCFKQFTNFMATIEKIY